jgi:branched-chain amino acid transport system permease protein
VVNFAHGALYAMGGYALIAVMHAGGAGYWLALAVAPLLVIPMAMAIERATINPIRHRPDVDTLLVTFGLSSMIVGAIEYVWGTGTTLLPPPSPFTGTVDVLGNQYPLYRLVAALVSLLVSAGVFAIIQFTPMGLRIRAITDDPGMAEALGVNIKRLLTLVFGFAAGLAALAGALGAPIFAIHPEMGMNILIDSFLVVVLGGLGSLTGSAIGAFFVALTKSIGGGYFAEWSTAFLFLIVALALIVRPTGVFGQGRVA